MKDLTPMEYDNLLASHESDFEIAINDLHEARTIIRALLGAPPPRTWKKWPVIHAKAKEFLKKLDKDLD